MKMSFIRYKVTPRDMLWLTMICHKVYEFLMSILIVLKNHSQPRCIARYVNVYKYGLRK